MQDPEPNTEPATETTTQAHEHGCVTTIIAELDFENEALRKELKRLFEENAELKRQLEATK